VTVNPKEAAKGGFAKLTFRVPTESDTASTTQLEVSFPADHPLAFVSVKPVPGWTFSVTKEKLAKPISSDDGEVSEAVSKITWTGGKIAPGEFQEFDVSVGPLPTDTDSLVFKAVQTYDNGDVVRWIDEATPGGEEPEHPAPVLTLTAASGDDHAAATDDATSESSDKSSSDGAARGLGVAGIVLGAAGLAFGLRKKPSATS
jgi:uncharacterized protein